MGGFADGVLLERAIDCVSGEEWLRAKGFVGLLAEAALKAGAVQPLDTDMVANLRWSVWSEPSGGGMLTCTSSTSSPLATTTPEPSCPPTRGSLVAWSVLAMF